MKQYILGASILLLCNAVYAQGPRLNFYSSYVFDDYFEVYGDSYNYFHGTIKGGVQWGAGVEFSLRENYSLELLYLRQETHAPSTLQDGQFNLASSEDLDVNLNYIMLAGNRHVLLKEGKLQTYAGLLVGVGIIDVTNESKNTTSSLTKFAWGIRMGVNIWATEKFGLKLQTQLISAVQAAGGGAYFGTGGSGVAVSSYSTIYQFGLGGGLTFRVGNKQQTPPPNRN
jgi:hypothetical protein